MAKGLLACGDDDKTICFVAGGKMILSFLVLIYIVAEMGIKVMQQGKFSLTMIEVIQTNMIIVLLFDLAYNVDPQQNYLYFIEKFFFNVLLCTIIYYIAYKITVKFDLSANNGNRSTIFKFVLVIRILYGVALMISAAIFCYDLKTNNTCAQFWHIIINIVSVILLGIMIIIGRIHHNKQLHAFDGIDRQVINDPMPRMWLLIIINFSCQVFYNLLQILQLIDQILLIYSGCHYSQVIAVDIAFQFLFLIFTFHLAFIITNYVLRSKRINDLLIFKKKGQNQRLELVFVDRSDLRSTLSKNLKSQHSNTS